MTIETINSVSYFDTNSGMEDTNEAYNTRYPSIKMVAGNSGIRDITRMDNEVFKFAIRFQDLTTTSFKIMVGCDASGNGMAVQFDSDGTDSWIRLVTTSGINAPYDSVLQEKKLTNIMSLTTGVFYECILAVAGNKLEFTFSGIPAIKYNEFALTGTNWGYCNLTGSAMVYVSDSEYIYDQVLYGNVNLNGAPNAKGSVMIYKQSTYQLVARVDVDENGEYMYFIDDDPANGNKYFMFGSIEDLTTVQPRGVMNITL